MGSTIKVSIITVSYNSFKFLKNYFSSIQKQNFSGIEVILTDNGSTDGSKEEMQKLKIKMQNDNLKFKIILNKKNLGFAKANNLGAKRALGKYLFFLNPDTKLKSNCLENLYQEAENINLDSFIFIPRQKSYDGKLFLNDGVCTDIFAYPFYIFKAGKKNVLKPPFFCDGAALFLPKKTFLELGMFDEDLFMFNEDVDLCWRAHILDIPLVNVLQANVCHFSGGSIKGGTRKAKTYKTTYQRRYLGERSAIRNILKNYSLPVLLWLLPLYFLINIGEILVFLVFLRFRVVLQYLKAWWWNLTNIRSIWKKRSWIQKKRKVSDFKILRNMYWGSGKLKAFVSIKIPQFE